MIKFFGKIRRQIVTENHLHSRLSKFKSYILYAVGEIVLVVVGIVIALQINNWNHIRIQNIESIFLKNRLLIESKKNIQNLNGEIAVTESLIEKSNFFLSMFSTQYLEKDIRLIDSLLYDLLVTPNYEFSSSTLDEALNTGRVSIIRSDSIKLLLYNIPRLMVEIRNSEEELNLSTENHLIPYLYEKISFRQIDNKFSPDAQLVGKSKLKVVDNRIILSELVFENMVDNRVYILGGVLFAYKRLHATLVKLVKLVEMEKKKKE